MDTNAFDTLDGMYLLHIQINIAKIIFKILKLLSFDMIINRLGISGKVYEREGGAEASVYLPNVKLQNTLFKDRTFCCH